MSLFQALAAMNGQLDALRLNIRFLEDGRLNVIVTPEVSDEARKSAPELANEFQLVATPAELDEGFARELQQLAAVRGTLADQVARQLEQIKNAKPKTEPTKTTKKATPALPAPSKDDGGDDDELSGTVATVAPESQASAAPVAVDALDLFGPEV